MFQLVISGCFLVFRENLLERARRQERLCPLMRVGNKRGLQASRICIIVLLIMSERTYLWCMSKLEGSRRLQELRDRLLCLVAWRICIVFFINYKCGDDTSVSFTMCTIVRECFKCRTSYDVSKAYRRFAF